MEYDEETKEQTPNTAREGRSMRRGYELTLGANPR
jgi:hypothetical protein